MKQILLYLSIIFGLGYIMYNTSHKPLEVYKNYPTVSPVAPARPVAKKKIFTPRKDLQVFLKKIAHFESGNNPTIINKYGMLGKYQFAPKTLQVMGVMATPEEFLNNERLQDSVMMVYLRQNKRSLRKVIEEFNNTYYRGVYVTTSGILAGAHLAGSGGVLSFFYPEKYSYTTVDRNGASVGMYISKFGNYNLGF